MTEGELPLVEASIQNIEYAKLSGFEKKAIDLVNFFIDNDLAF